MFCSQCANDLVQEDAFCPKCGAPRPVLVGAGHDARTWQRAAGHCARGGAVGTADDIHADGVGWLRRPAATGSVPTGMRIDQALAVAAAKHAGGVLGASILVMAVIGGLVTAVTDVSLGLTDILRIAVFITGAAFRRCGIKGNGDLDSSRVGFW